MLTAGEDARFIARRLVILASEDIGNADPLALVVANAAAHAVEYVGLPEAQLNLAQAVTYLAAAPKSNASYVALKRALSDVQERRAHPIPKHLRDSRSAHGKAAEERHGLFVPARLSRRLCPAVLPPRRGTDAALLRADGERGGGRHQGADGGAEDLTLPLRSFLASRRSLPPSGSASAGPGKGRRRKDLAIIHGLSSPFPQREGTGRLRPGVGRLDAAPGYMDNENSGLSARKAGQQWKRPIKFSPRLTSSFRPGWNAHRDELIEKTQRLLQVPSVKGDPAPGAPFGAETRRALDLALGFAAEYGLTVRNLDGYAGHAEWVGEGVAPGAEIVGVLAHVDVVPEGDGWKHPPFGAQIADGKIFARGAIDDKGPAMAALFGMLAVKECGVPLAKRLRLILGADEESGFGCVKHYFAHEEMPATGFTPDGMFPLVYAEEGHRQHHPDAPRAAGRGANPRRQPGGRAAAQTWSPTPPRPSCSRPTPPGRRSRRG